MGDSVCYQHGVHTSGAKRAVNVQAKRKMQESLIDSIKGDYGFIVFEGNLIVLLILNILINLIKMVRKQRTYSFMPRISSKRKYPSLVLAIPSHSGLSNKLMFLINKIV